MSCFLSITECCSIPRGHSTIFTNDAGYLSTPCLPTISRSTSMPDCPPCTTSTFNRRRSPNTCKHVFLVPDAGRPEYYGVFVIPSSELDKDLSVVECGGWHSLSPFKCRECVILQRSSAMWNRYRLFKVTPASQSIIVNSLVNSSGVGSWRCTSRAGPGSSKRWSVDVNAASCCGFEWVILNLNAHSNLDCNHHQVCMVITPCLRFYSRNQ